MKDALIISVLSVLPRKRGARVMGWFARTRFSRLIVRGFVRAYGLNMEEAARPLAEYTTLHELFVRELKSGVRPIDERPHMLVSPVDGTVAAVGRSSDQRIALTPDRSLSLTELLQESPAGELDAIVLYLSPKDYHRVHAPSQGEVNKLSYLPGTLWPVFPAAVRRVEGLFSRNERAHLHLNTADGPIEVVMIGAFGVGRMTLTCSDLITNTGKEGFKKTLNDSFSVARGEHIGTFHLGSTVVLVTPRNQWVWDVEPGEPVKLGAAIAHRAPSTGES